MAYAIQFDLFESNDEISLLKKELLIIDKKYSNVQRGMFARHGEMMKLILKQQDEIDKLKSMLTPKKEIIEFKILSKG